MTESQKKTHHLLVVAFLTLVAGLVRLPGLTTKAYWIAEVQEFAYAYRGDFLAHPVFSAGDFPGYLYHSFCHVLGLPPMPLVTRLPAFLLGTALPGTFYLLATRMKETRAGLAAGLLWAFSLPALQLSQEARLYAAVSFLVGLGLLLHMAMDSPSRRRVLTLGIVDGLALSAHPYAAFWLLVRWVARLSSSTAWRHWVRPHTVWPYLVVTLPFFALQVGQVAVAASRFRILHTFFSLQPYPPDFPLLHELLAHFGPGPGVGAALFGLAVLAGAYLWSLSHPGRAVTLAAMALVAPAVVTLGIWLGQSRFGFVHMMPAAYPCFLLAGVALERLFSWRSSRPFFFRVAAVALLALFIARMGTLNWRYFKRQTKLEMGSDVAGACGYLASSARPGDLLVTTYDKYFTLFVWYCGPTLNPGVQIAADRVPEDPFVLAFNHLAADGNTSPLPARRVVPLASADLPPPGHHVYVLIPYFEDIEGQYSESLGWYRLSEAYGPAIGPDDSTLASWEVTQLPLMKVLRKPVRAGETFEELHQQIRRVHQTRRSWF